MAMTKKTPQQLHNVREALEVWWPSVPEANVIPRLSDWTKGSKDGTHCGIVACFGGWCARWPGLQEQGLRVGPTGCMAGMPVGPGPSVLFGDDRLWAMRDHHPADKGFTGTDHELVTNRLRWALEH